VYALVVPRPPARRVTIFIPFHKGFHVPGTLLDAEPELDEEFLVRDTIVLAGGMSAIVHIAREPLRWSELVSVGLADAYAEGVFDSAPGIDPLDPDLLAERKLRNMLQVFANSASPYWHGFETTLYQTSMEIPLARRAYQEYYDSQQAGEDTP